MYGRSSLEPDSPVPQICRLSQQVNREDYQFTPTLLEHEQLAEYQSSSESGTSLNMLSKLRAGIKIIISDRAICGSGDGVFLIRWQEGGGKGVHPVTANPKITAVWFIVVQIHPNKKEIIRQLPRIDKHEKEELAVYCRHIRHLILAPH